jgi:hypothetical protein
MASTYSPNLKIELIGTGDQSGTWGNTTNTNLGTLLEEAIAGYVTQAVTDGAATVLTIPNGASSNGRNYVIELTGALTAARTVEVPAVDKPYIFFNNTTGGFSVTVKVSGQTGVTIANGKKAIVYTNATDVIEVANAPVTEAGTQTLTNKTLTNPTINGFTGSTAVINVGSGQFYKDTSGNVGIGTASPSTKLEVSGSSAANTIYQSITNTNATGYSALFLNVGVSGAFGQAGINYRPGTSLAFGPALNDTTTPIVFQTSNSTERMRIDSSGNVGIGIASPTSILDVRTSNPTRGIISSVVNTAASSQTGSQIRITQGGIEDWVIGQPAAVSAFSIWSGRNVSADGTERMRIDSSGNVGIGVTPNAWGSFYKVIQSTASSTFCITTQVNDIEVGSGYYNVNSGFSSLYINTGSTKPSRYLQSNGVHIWQSANTGTAGNTISWTSALTLDASGNLTAAGNITAYSDARLKKNVSTIDNALALVEKMRGVRYDRIDSGKAGIGVIAQEMQEVLPEVVHEGEEHLSVAYGNLVGVLIEAVKELSARVKELEAK